GVGLRLEQRAEAHRDRREAVLVHHDLLDVLVGEGVLPCRVVDDQGRPAHHGRQVAVMDGEDLVAPAADPDPTEGPGLARFDDAVHVDAFLWGITFGDQRWSAPFLAHRERILRREIQELAREAVELLPILTHRRPQPVVVDDPDLRRQPLAPALRADALLDLLTERAREPRLPGALAGVAAPRAGDDRRPARGAHRTRPKRRNGA